jgi:hypothetical protein
MKPLHPGRAASLAAALLLWTAAATAADPTEEWALTHDGGGSYTDEGSTAVVDLDGNLIVAGESHDGVGGTDMLVMKLDRLDHHVVWQHREAAADGNDMAVSRIVLDGGGDVLVGGYVRGCVG